MTWDPNGETNQISSGFGSPTTWQLNSKTFPSLILHESKSLRNLGLDGGNVAAAAVVVVVVIACVFVFVGDLIISVLYVHTDSVISLPGGESSSDMCR